MSSMISAPFFAYLTVCQFPPIFLRLFRIPLPDPGKGIVEAYYCWIPDTTGVHREFGSTNIYHCN